MAKVLLREYYALCEGGVCQDLLTEEEKRFRPNLEKGHGAASPLNLVRLYDKSNREEDIRVTFYRDHGELSTPAVGRIFLCGSMVRCSL